MNGRPKRTPLRIRKFLDVLRTGRPVCAACEVSGIARRSAYEWRDADPNFRNDWDEAIEEGNEYLENEAIRRAVEGTLRPIYQGGIRVGTVREYSDNLLMFTMKGKMPAKYKENATEVNNNVKVINVPASSEGSNSATPSFRTREHLE